MMPSAPAATAARAMGITLSRSPVPCDGSAMMGKCDSLCTTGMAARSNTLRVAGAQALGGGCGAAPVPGSAAQNPRPRPLHQASCTDGLPLTLARARAREGDDVGAADGHAAGKTHDGVLRFPLPAHLLVRLGDVD